MPMKSKKVNCDINLMIRGIGGQGVKLAGSIIGQAAIYDHRHAVQSMKYGSAITGGETRSEIKVSTERIIYPRMTDIDVYVALTQDDLENFFDAQIYLTATEVAKTIPKVIKDKLILAPMLTISEQVGSRKTMNMVLLGVLNQLFNLASDDSFEKAIEKLTAPKFHEINKKAYFAGKKFDLTKENPQRILKLANICKIDD
ncbi:MAG: 2-oxoacid:acceptor oxidoreductase family protein [Candidatus Heimdallarchaeota archaeon]